MSRVIVRQEYLNRIERWFGKETIVVLVGQRRVGKSYMLKQLCDLKQSSTENNVTEVSDLESVLENFA
jgi:predicted AAA+ superfamily ATPase